ncbi:MAG: hypothetical protein Q9210_003454 [Variospora velana]
MPKTNIFEMEVRALLGAVQGARDLDVDVNNNAVKADVKDIATSTAAAQPRSEPSETARKTVFNSTEENKRIKEVTSGWVTTNDLVSAVLSRAVTRALRAIIGRRVLDPAISKGSMRNNIIYASYKVRVTDMIE